MMCLLMLVALVQIYLDTSMRGQMDASCLTLAGRAGWLVRGSSRLLGRQHEGPRRFAQVEPRPALAGLGALPVLSMDAMPTGP